MKCCRLWAKMPGKQEVVLRNLGTAKKNQVLEAVADSLVAHADKLLAANAIDVENSDVTICRKALWTV